MADQRITQLTSLPKASVAANDALPVADISASQTKKVTVKDLVDAGLDLVDSSSIDLAKLDQASTTKLGSAAIASAAITPAKLGANSSIAVQGTAPVADNFEGRGFFDSGTNNLRVYTGAGGYQQIVIPTAGIAEAAVTTDRLADGAVTTAKVTALGTTAYADSSITAAKLQDDSVTEAKIATNAVTATQIAPDAVGASELADNAVDTASIQNLAVTTEKLAAESVTTAKIGDAVVTTAKIADASVTTAKLDLADNSIDGAKLIDQSVTAAQLENLAITTQKIADTAVTTAKLADGAITTAKYQSGSIDSAALGLDAVTEEKIVDGAVTYEKIQSVSASDKLLGRASAGAGTLEEIDCTAAGRALLAGATAESQRTSLGLGTVSTVNIITANEVDTQAITAIKLANESTVDLVTTLPASGVFTGQLALNTTNNTLYCWSGAQWVALKAAGSINSIVSDNSGIVNTQITIADDVATVSTSIDNTTAAAQFLAGPTNAAGAVSFRTIAGADLPTPTTSTKGAVVVNGNGLAMVSDTLAIDNVVTASGSEYRLVQYNVNGLVTDGRLIQAGDLPVATDLIAGTVLPGSGLSVTAAGLLNHTNNIAASTGTKVTFDSEGHITGTASLEAVDIPELDASKITTGTFGSAFLAPNSVTAEQLADYGIAKVSETAPTPEFAGQWWINPSDRSAYIWVGTVTPTVNGYWLLVGYGSPTQLNLRFGGTYDANTNTVVTLNQYGTEAGLTVGQPLTAPNSQNNGIYLAVTTAGTGTTPAPAASLAIGDWVLSQGTGANWTKVAVVSGASGTFNDYDILSDGTYFSPNMSGVADVRDALELIWGRVQIASTVQLGVVKESSEVLVDNSTGEMTIGIVDDGSY